MKIFLSTIIKTWNCLMAKNNLKKGNISKIIWCIEIAILNIQWKCHVLTVDQQIEFQEKTKSSVDSSD